MIKEGCKQGDRIEKKVNELSSFVQSQNIEDINLKNRIESVEKTLLMTIEALSKDLKGINESLNKFMIESLQRIIRTEQRQDRLEKIYFMILGAFLLTKFLFEKWL